MLSVMKIRVININVNVRERGNYIEIDLILSIKSTKATAPVL